MAQSVITAVAALQGTTKAEVAAAVAAVVDAVLLSALEVSPDDDDLAFADASLTAKPQLQVVISAMADASGRHLVKRALGLLFVCDSLLKLRPEGLPTPARLSDDGIAACDAVTLKEAAVTCIASATADVAPALYAEVRRLAAESGHDLVGRQAAVIVAKWRDQGLVTPDIASRMFAPVDVAAAGGESAAAATATTTTTTADNHSGTTSAALRHGAADEDAANGVEDVVASAAPIRGAAALSSAEAGEQSALLKLTLEALSAIPPAVAAPLWESLRLHEGTLRQRTPEALEALRAVSADAVAERRRRAVDAVRGAQAPERRVMRRHTAPDAIHPRPRPLALQCDVRRLDLPPPNVPPRCTGRCREVFSVSTRMISAAGAARGWWPDTASWLKTKNTGTLHFAVPRPLELKRTDDDIILF